MTPAEARQVIEVFAGGIDPATGEVLADDSPLSNPHVIRALFLAAKALELMAGKAARPATAAPGNAGKAWSDAEDQRGNSGAALRFLMSQRFRSEAGKPLRAACDRLLESPGIAVP